jgi:1,4-dihydroxy-6-naphthoate synthase
LFSDIEDVVLSGEYDAGLLIHENRFTFEDKGLVSLMDLGDYWENLTWLPIPLGGIVMKREFPQETKQLVSDLIRQSVEYAFKHTEEALPYIRQYAQTMSDEVMLKHIGLYVNEYSLDLGDKGKTAVQRLMDTAVDSHLISNYHTPIWI